MHPSLASIMPQAVAVWCEKAGHEVTFVCFTGSEDLVADFPEDLDILFIGAFSQAAQLSYALSNLFRQRGAVTVLGGPHARCYPEDAVKYFDYVLGFTDESLIHDVLDDCLPHRPLGRELSSPGQPATLPTVRERWKYIRDTIEKSPTKIKLVPMLASLGCPYTCSFCIDSVVKYQPFDPDGLVEDLRFVASQPEGSYIGWHDPNFGVRFDDVMSAVEAIPRGQLGHAAESSLSILSESHLKRLRDTGFQAVLPGIESWYSLGDKSKTGRTLGMEKVNRVSEHLNLVLEYIPYVQANFVLGLDCDEGPEPFELQKTFVDKSPGVFPGYSLLTSFGQAAPLNLELQEAGRVLPFPFHFLNNNAAMNVKPKNYGWLEFYGHVIDVTHYTFSGPRIARRLRVNRGSLAGWLNFVRAISSEGRGRIKYFRTVVEQLNTNRDFRRYFECETETLPSFFMDQIRRDLGPLWEYLPEGAIYHDQNAYLKRTKRQETAAPVLAPVPPAMRVALS